MTKYRKNYPLELKFLERMLQGDGCWEWIAGKDTDGYGRIWVGKNKTAHTLAYELFNGPVEGLHVLHTCDNPGCVNPDHLVLGTHSDNMRDKSVRKRVHGEKNPNYKGKK